MIAVTRKSPSEITFVHDYSAFPEWANQRTFSYERRLQHAEKQYIFATNLLMQGIKYECGSCTGGSNSDGKMLTLSFESNSRPRPQSHPRPSASGGIASTGSSLIQSFG